MGGRARRMGWDRMHGCGCGCGGGTEGLRRRHARMQGVSSRRSLRLHPSVTPSPSVFHLSRTLRLSLFLLILLLISFFLLLRPPSPSRILTFLLGVGCGGIGGRGGGGARARS
ncbi:hypothetical protein B0H11DRAFT_857414 [Mycena galericulata]|nr:hypothetical protein B0H11DRAFT_857414 [Mycena galericulata]